MDYSGNHQQPQYDPSSQTYHQFYDQHTTNYYPYTYPTPQIQPYSYPNPNAQHEPNPPGVTAPPPQLPPQDQIPFYQYHSHGAAVFLPAGSQQGGVDAGVSMVQQPIVQSPYGGIGIIGGIVPQGVPQIHPGPNPNVPHRPYHGWGRGRGGGRGRGRGRGAARNKHPAQVGQQIQLDPTQALSQVPAQPAPVLPPPKLVSCELCRVECNTIEILQQHLNGKKHQKKLKVFEELQNLNKKVIGRQVEEPTSISGLISEALPQPDQIVGSSSHQLQGESLPSQAINEESKVAEEKQKVEEGGKPTEESKEKVKMDQPGRGLKRKMRGGKAGGRKTRPFERSKRPVEPPKPKEVAIPLVCELCNVKCESAVVFQSHLVGKKHSSNAKRFMGQQGALGKEAHQAFGTAELAIINQQITNASTFMASQPHQRSSIAEVEAVSQPQPLAANIGASVLVNAEGTFTSEGSLGSVVPSDRPALETVKSGITLEGASVFERIEVVPSSAVAGVPGAETIIQQLQSSGSGEPVSSSCHIV